MRTLKEKENLICRECIDNKEVDVDLPYAVKNLEFCAMNDDLKSEIIEMQNSFYEEKFGPAGENQ